MTTTPAPPLTQVPTTPTPPRSPAAPTGPILIQSRPHYTLRPLPPRWLTCGTMEAAAAPGGLGNKRHFAATIVSMLIDFSDLIAANGDDINQTRYPHGRWNNSFTAEMNPTADFCKDPRSFSLWVHMQAASFGLLANSACSVRDGVPFCGCEIAGGIPQFNTVGTKEHFLPWTDPAAQATSTFVGKQVKLICSAHCATYKLWCNSIPSVSPAHQCLTRLRQDLQGAEKTIRGFLFTGVAHATSPQACVQPALLLVCQVRNTWAVVGIMDGNLRAPSMADVIADINFTI
ncbi:hypothetical protein HDU86_001509 [Geranomyces michiganensis]|nr:hypothetical protein HDU86_001509 [Geranomyces michiganensis]